VNGEIPPALPRLLQQIEALLDRILKSDSGPENL
jgi:hypothetical protein